MRRINSIGPIMQAQLARWVTPDLVEWHTTILGGSVEDAERAAIIHEFGDHGDVDALHARIADVQTTRRRQARAASLSTLAWQPDTECFRCCRRFNSRTCSLVCPHRRSP